MSLHLKRTNELKSCIGLIEDETSYSDDEFHLNYCNQKLRLFKNNNFALSVRIIGNEKVNDVGKKSIRNTKSSSTGYRSTPWARSTQSTRDITISKICTILSLRKNPSTTSRSSQVASRDSQERPSSTGSPAKTSSSGPRSFRRCCKPFPSSIQSSTTSTSSDGLK